MVKYVCLSFSELSLTQLYDVMALRQEVFVVEQNCPYLDADGRDQDSYHVLGYKDEKLVTYTRLVPQGLSYDDYVSIGRVVSSPLVRGEGLGDELMNKSVAYCRKIWRDTAIKISAQCYLLKWYKKLGFEPVGTEYLEDDIPHHAMVLKTVDGTRRTIHGSVSG